MYVNDLSTSSTYGGPDQRNGSKLKTHWEKIKVTLIHIMMRQMHRQNLFEQLKAFRAIIVNVG
jgi:hypothetical protein